MITIAHRGILADPQIAPRCVTLSPFNRSTALKELQEAPQREMPVTHRFQPGVYLREIFMPADTFVVGYVHKHRHYNVVISGKCRVAMNGGEVREICAGDVFESGEGVQKWLHVLEDTRWLTIHANPTDSTDVPKLEEAIVHIDPSTLSAKGGMTLDELRMLNTRKELSTCPLQ